MPEGDAVRRTCARLQEALAGRTLLAAELRWPGLSTADLTGAVVAGVVPRGKHILIRLDTGWTLHSHLRMEGRWRIEPTRRPVEPTRRPVEPVETPAWRNPDARAILVTDRWTAVGLRLGRLDLLPTPEEATLLSHLGPDILDPDFDLAAAVANLALSEAPIGSALLDQRNLAGIGTIWASESLFAEKLHPWAAQLSHDELQRLVQRARRLMQASLIRPDEPRVHGRSGRPCPRCGGILRVAQIGPPTRERAMFYCPSCQGGLAPGDDGHPIAPLGARRRGRPYRS